MQYPNHILPQQNFRKIVNFQPLHNYYLIHFTDTKDNKDPQDGRVREDCIVRQTDHIRDFSNNLLGTFELDDIYIELTQGEFKNYFNSEWEEASSPARVPQFEKDFIINKNRGFFFLPISECDDYEVQYSDGSNVNPICKILHTPTNSNFWHVSLRWFHNGQDISELHERQRKKAEIKRVLLAAKAFIQEKGKFEIPSYQSIDISFYT
ncbi:hypothetical protein [Chryseolinea sp. H1M3-3]|uniref:hypothetical protein n=1 Tax=Chryseolinea sp. H1M3-3 TaxID=3034144 RepID=UPI0023ED1810|nr:hypothetical protein [Chryseolinea sp. H1M3-3]